MYMLKISGIREAVKTNLGLILPEYIPNESEVIMGIVPIGGIAPVETRVSIVREEMIDPDWIYAAVLYKQRSGRYKLKFVKSDILARYYRG